MGEINEVQRCIQNRWCHFQYWAGQPPDRSRPFLPRKLPRIGLHIGGWPQEWCYGTSKWVLRWATFFRHLTGQVPRVTGAELVLAQGTQPGFGVWGSVRDLTAGKTA